MKLTKHEHSCMVVENERHVIVAVAFAAREQGDEPRQPSAERMPRHVRLVAVLVIDAVPRDRLEH